MHFRLTVLPATIIAALFFLISCQSSPIVPSQDPAPGLQNNSVSTSGTPTLRQSWGYYHCVADLDSGEISVLPDRSADLHINATKPLNNTLGIGISIDPSSTPATGYLVIDVSITHPFPGSMELTGFDVRGILIGSGEYNASGLRIPGPDDPMLVNADGWSRWWNPSEFTDPGLLGYFPGLYGHPDPANPLMATLNPYKLFADSLSSTADVDFIKYFSLIDPSGRATFRAGSTNTRQYQIQFPVNGGPKIYFDYAVDASWAMPLVNPPVTIPEDFPIWANSIEAFDLVPSLESCTLAGTQFGCEGSGELVLNIEVWDWQGWSNGNYDNQVGTVRLYSPFVDFDLPVVERTDDLHFTRLIVTATGVPSKIGLVPVYIEIPSPGSFWKQAGPTAPGGEVSSYARMDIEIIEMTCEGDLNETCDDAVSMDLDDSIQGAVCSPYDLSDYYVFTIGNSQVMQGTITLDNFDYGDNDLIVYDGCPGDPLLFAMNPYGVTETIEIENLESGIYYIAVTTGETAGTDVQPYTLTTDIHQDGDQCTIDSNNEYTDAESVGLQDNVDESVCAGGDLRDWFKITVPSEQVAGGTIYVNNDGTGDIEIRIYDSYPGPATFWGNNPDTQDELVIINGLGPGTHYIELFANGANPEGDRGFSMDLDLITSTYTCDSADGNNSDLTADPVGYTDVQTGTVCFPGDYDWFVIDVDDDTVVNGTVTLSGDGVADNDIFVYSESGELLEFGAHVGISDEVVTLSQLEPGNYFVKVAAHPNVGNGDQPFTMTMDLEAEESGILDFLIHAHIICKDDGSNPAQTVSHVQNDVAWADEFYGQWGGSISLAEISYIKRTSWLAATTNEMYQCHFLHGDKSGPINVYYVNSFPDMSNAAAYCRMDCRPAYQTHKSTYVAMSDYASNRVLAHELGHATGIFHDVYLLDAGFSSCDQINQYYCSPGANLSFCDEDDADYGNLMYFGVYGWNDPEDYWLSDYHWDSPSLPIESQMENRNYFQINYEYNF